MSENSLPEGGEFYILKRLKFAAKNYIKIKARFAEISAYRNQNLGYL